MGKNKNWNKLNPKKLFLLSMSFLIVAFIYFGVPDKSNAVSGYITCGTQLCDEGCGCKLGTVNNGSGDTTGNPPGTHQEWQCNCPGGGGVNPPPASSGSCQGDLCDHWPDICNLGNICHRGDCNNYAQSGCAGANVTTEARCTALNTSNQPGSNCHWVPNNPPPPAATRTPTPAPTTPPGGSSCPATKGNGDADCNGVVDLVDYSIWLNNQCHPGAGQSCGDLRADFNGDGNVDDADYAIWQAHFGS